jgi:hypothetical protein
MWREYFKLVKIVPGKVIVFGFGEIDFSSDKIPVETCKKLYEADCHYLEITKKGEEELYGIKPPKPKRKYTRRKKKSE